MVFFLFFGGGGGGGGDHDFFPDMFSGGLPQIHKFLSIRLKVKGWEEGKRNYRNCYNTKWLGAGREERRWHTFTFLSILCSSYLALKESTKSIHLLNLCWIFVKCTYFMSLLKVCYQSVFAESLKFYFGLSLHIFQHFLWKICATPDACIKPGCLARRPLYHKVNLLGYVAQRPLCHEVYLPRCSNTSRVWRSASLFNHDLWYFQHQTNAHF